MEGVAACVVTDVDPILVHSVVLLQERGGARCSGWLTVYSHAVFRGNASCKCFGLLQTPCTKHSSIVK